MFCIVLAYRPHLFCKYTFLKPGLMVEKFENTALAFSCGQRIRTLCVSMTPSPHPSNSSLRPLNPATSHNNNTNNGGLHACGQAAEDIEPYSSCSRAWVAAAVRPHYRSTQTILVVLHKPFSSLLFVFSFFVYCLFVYIVQALCARSISSFP